jgi:hypothetical protein
MKCEKCKRQLTESEPVYRLYWNVHSGMRMVCGMCEAQVSASSFLKRTWHPSRPCCHCSRPVFLYQPIRKGLRYFVCGIECRQAVHNANYRRLHPRSHAKQRCQSCGHIFTPKRNDAKFCSVACKQRAYRVAHRSRTVTIGMEEPSVHGDGLCARAHN